MQSDCRQDLQVTQRLVEWLVYNKGDRATTERCRLLNKFSFFNKMCFTEPPGLMHRIYITRNEGVPGRMHGWCGDNRQINLIGTEDMYFCQRQKSTPYLFLHITWIKLILEYCIHFWCPHFSYFFPSLLKNWTSCGKKASASTLELENVLHNA